MSALPTPEPRELLNALLDGELSDDEEREVRAWLDVDADGKRELALLTEVRAAVRDLPAVEPPTGFFERLLLDADAEIDAPEPQPVIAEETAPILTTGPTTTIDPADEKDGSVVTPLSAAPSRRRRSMVGAAIASVAAVAAAFVLVLGITPATDKVVPPVQAFAERHDSMMASPPTAPFAGSEYQPVSAGELDNMGAPYMAPARFGDFSRQSAYRQNDVVHVVYSRDGMVFSVYEQRGAVDWSQIPPNGKQQELGATKAWETRMGNEEIMVMELDGMVVTMVSDAPADQMMAVAKDVPSPPTTSMMDRASRNCSKLVRAFTGGS